MPGILCGECGRAVPEDVVRCPQCGAPVEGIDEDTEQLAREVGEALGSQYVVLEKIGRGGYAVVFRVHDRQLDRDLAAKTLIPEFASIPHLAERFRREASLVARLNHPSVVPIYFVAGEGETACCVMPFIKGETLGARLRREGRIAPRVALSIAQDVASALDVAHGAGFVHRDVKPDNVLMEFTSGRAMLSDFGIAKALDQDARLTATGVIIGTPFYMSPEQASGEQDIDARSDVYSLASVIWHMLVGEPPYGGSNAQMVLGQHVSAPVPDLMVQRSDLGAQTAEVMAQALAKNREDRFHAAGEFVVQLEAALGSPGIRKSGGMSMVRQGSDAVELFRTLTPEGVDDPVQALKDAGDVAAVLEAAESVAALAVEAAGRSDADAVALAINTLSEKLYHAPPPVRHPLERALTRLAQVDDLVGVLASGWATDDTATQSRVEAAIEAMKPHVADTLLLVARRGRSAEAMLLADRTGIVDDDVARALAQDTSASVVEAFVTAVAESVRPNDTVEKWLGMATRHSSAAVRKYVAEVAAIRGSAVAERVARLLLGDSDEDVRATAIAALGASRRKEVLPDLVSVLENGTQQEQVAAAAALGALGIPAVVKPLEGVLQRKQLLRLLRGPVQLAAARALVSLPDDLAQPALDALRSDRDPEIRALVTDRLGT